MNTNAQSTGRFDMLGQEIFNQDLVEIIFLDDIDDGLVTSEILRVNIDFEGEAKVIDKFGNCIDLNFFPDVVKAA